MTPLEKAEGDLLAVRKELRVLKSVNQGTIALQRVTIAALKKDRACMRGEWSAIEADHWNLVLAIKQWESRTGLEHEKVLEGVFGNPLGSA